MYELMDKLDRRQLNLIMFGALVLLAGALSAYLVWPQVKSYREAGQSRTVLGNAVANSDLAQQLDKLRGDVSSLRQRLHGDMANLPEEQMEAYVVGRLQNISWRNRVELAGVEPKAGDQVENFRETLFEVKLSGNYFDLYDWVRDVARDLGFVVIKRYEMTPTTESEEDPPLEVSLTLASYRPLEQ